MPARRKRTARRAVAPATPDPSAHFARVRRIKGQVEGVQRMLAEQRPAAEVLMQIGAARAALRGLETALLREQAGLFLRQPPRGTGAEGQLEALLSLFQRLSS